MAKNLKTKVYICILLSIILSILILNNNVKASSTDAEEKIMKYDATTGEITEVEEEELLQVINNSRSTDGGVKLEAYDPYKLDYSPRTAFNSIMRVSPGYRITDTSVFPYRTTCKVVAYRWD